MNNKIKYTMGERIFQAANTVFMLLILLITLYPFYYAVIASISDGSELVRGNVLFLPVKPTLEAYTLIPGIKNFRLRQHHLLHGRGCHHQLGGDEHGGVCHVPRPSERSPAGGVPGFFYTVV